MTSTSTAQTTGGETLPQVRRLVTEVPGPRSQVAWPAQRPEET